VQSFVKQLARFWPPANRRASDKIDQCLARAQDDVAAGLGSPEYYADEYRRREIGYWEHILGWIARMPRGSRVLDVGAAYGTLAVFSRRLLDAEVTIVDAVPYYQPAALLAREGIRHITRNIELDSIADLGLFDLVIFTEVLEHLNFRAAPSLAKLRDALVPGGSIVLSTPDAESKWGRFTKYYARIEDLPDADPNAAWIDDHVWQYDRTELEAALSNAGFRIREVAIARGNDGFTHLNARAVRPRFR